MTADIRTAAQREAVKRWPLKYPNEINLDQRRLNMPTRMAREDFVDGYLAGAARVTPTREQIADVIEQNAAIARSDAEQCAVAIASLIAGLAEGETQ